MVGDQPTEPRSGGAGMENITEGREASGASEMVSLRTSPDDENPLM